MLVACFVLEQFGIAVERTRLPHLWGEPVALLADSGALAAVSDEALPYGIRPGQSASGARALCPSLAVLPYDRCAYELAAQPLWDLFAIESSVVEPASPELCYVELTGREVLPRVRWLAEELARTVRVPVKIGLGRTKFVARQAALKSGETPLRIPLGGEAAFLAALPLERVPGLDQKRREQLERLGVHTLGDVTRLPPRHLRRQMKEVGYLLERLAVGEDGDRVRPLWPPRHLEHRIAWEDETDDAAQVREALRLAAEALSGRLGAEYARALTLRVTLADQSVLQETERLSLPLHAASCLHGAALRLLGRMRIDRPLIELCLQASDLGTGSGLQRALLDENRFGEGLPHERQERLESTLAYLRRRFGPGAVLHASLLRQAKRIGLWTYTLGHLLNEPITVATDRRGKPVRYWRRGRAREVKRIQNSWRETQWSWGSVSEWTVYRVETEPCGLSELHRLGVRWTLGGIAD